MARTPTEIGEEQQSAEQLQEMKETQAAQAAAATGQDEPVESDPELLGRLQDPHKANRPEVKTAVFLDAYGNKVRAAV